MNKISRYDRAVVAKRANKSERSENASESKSITMTNVDNAPMIFADKVPVYGTIGEVITATLAAERPVGESIAISATVHLRLTRDAARVLATSLLDALAMGENNEKNTRKLN